jgi:predicted RNA-binding protein YlxR (DUF448 family)
VTGERLDSKDLIRFVLGPGTEVVADLKHNLPGRGVWVRAARHAVAAAVAKQLFHKAFRTGCTADPELPARIEELLREEARQYLALANKAGLVAAGFDQTLAALTAGKARVLLEAADGSEDGRRKLRGKRPAKCEIIAMFDSRELDLALGRANVIHAAVAEGGLAEKLLAAARRLEAYTAEAAKHGIDGTR